MDPENTETTVDETQVEQGPTREELLAAVREAGGTESVDVASEQAAAEARAKNPPADTTVPAVPSADDRLAALLKGREENRDKRLTAEEYAAKVRSDADAQRKQMLDDARAEARRVMAEEIAAERAKLRADPVAHLRSLGENPQDVIDAVLRAGSPEEKARAKSEAELATLREEAKLGKSAKDDIAALRQELADNRMKGVIREVKTAFLGTHATRETAPYLHARFDPDEIFERANQQTIAWQKEGLVLGKDFDEAMVTAYLEKQSREKITSVLPGTPAHQVRAGAASAAGSRPQGLATGSRTLPAAAGSERRASPRPLEELTPEQQREELIKEAAAARRANPGSMT